ncbi:M14 family zinc carboxypeptidase [Brevibacillus choshinensis]|uniref:M14 family zinc carboxypeptidase n=1 Tax=Brevibacillus choshinensis TaxID=54911 RepID=UPI002E1E7ECC|nr:M14 family zinc carboxypeptidase [Brevibacillus choshinensis]MED4755277.1 M14 family zinc carboxypeptidase [Brevibacillus choshinensis]
MKKACSIAGALLLTASLVSPVFAAGSTSPGIPNQQQYSISGFLSYEQLVEKLKKVEHSSNGQVSLEAVGKSNHGRDIYKATVGSGKKVVFITSQIHGNEPTGTEALVSLLQYLGSSNSPDAKQIRKEITLVAMPMMNPDAAFLDRRGNDMTWEEVVADFPQLADVKPAWNYYTTPRQGDDYTEKPGFDVNRDYNPDLNYSPQATDFPGGSSKPGWFITPEAQTVRDVYQSLQDNFGQVNVYIDLHHQGPFYYVEGTNDVVTMSLSGRFVADPNSPAGAKYEEYADKYNYDFSRQLNLAAYNALQSMGNSPFDNISLYDQKIDLPGTALGTFALNGSGTVLFEVRGQTQSMGQKKKGQLVKAVETGLYGILDAVSTGSIDELDPEDYDDIPITSYEPGI